MDINTLALNTPEPQRFHLILAKGGTGDDFRELVAANDLVTSDGEWWVTTEQPMNVSSVEVDARAARWSRKTGGFALRISRTDAHRWWLAVHHNGQRLTAFVHDHGDAFRHPSRPTLVEAELGRDPLLELLKEPGLSPDDVRNRVASQRAEQLVGALTMAGVELNVSEIAEILKGTPPHDNLPQLLRALGANEALSLTQQLQAANTAIPDSMQNSVNRAIVTGCAFPALIGVITFVTLARFATKAGMSPMGALLFGSAASWGAMWMAKNVMKRFTPGEDWKSRTLLSWATDLPSAAQRPIRPTPAALNTWGGLFYLLRDIAFFGGIDRPRGPMALYVEVWGMGPPPLVDTINKTSSGELEASNPLFDAAQALVSLRDRLIDRHLAGEQIQPEQVAEQVRHILQPAVTA